MLFSVQIRTNGDEWIVCREAFISIHRITVGRVRHIAYFAKNSPTPPVDKHGKKPDPHVMKVDSGKYCPGGQ